MIRIHQLKKSFGKHAVLKGIDAVFEKGRVYGIVGENGAGKTTFFKCLAGLETFEGTIESDFKNLKDHTGLLTTDPYFFPKITGSEYIRLLCNARATNGGNYEERNIFDLPLQEYAVTYSTGMKKKLALTAILFQGNDFLILDEPFNGVDIHSNILITEIIHRLKALNKIVLISSHIFSTLQENCDEIHLLQNGQFTRRAMREEFTALEAEMKAFTIGNLVDKLGLV